MSYPYMSHASATACARLTGLAYLALAGCGIFGGFIAIASQVVPGDALATAGNIRDAGGLYRIGLLAWIATIVMDVFVAWGLYVIMKPTAPHLAVLMAWGRIVYVAIHGAAIMHLALAQKYAVGADFLNVFTQEELAGFASMALVSHKTAFEIALVFFGGHLLLLALLFWRSAYMPAWIGWLLALSGLVYIADAAAYIGHAGYDDIAMVLVALVSITAIIAELSLAFYLLFVGVGKDYTASAALR